MKEMRITAIFYKTLSGNESVLDWKMKQNNYWGYSLESFLEEEGMVEEANSYATKKNLAWQIFEAMKEQRISKSDMPK